MATYWWWIEIGILIGLALLLNLIQYLFYRRLSPYFQHKEKIWSYAVVNALQKPLRWFVWFLALSFSLEIFLRNFSLRLDIVDYLDPVRRAMGIIFILWFAMRLIKYFEKGLLQHRRLGKHEFHDATTVNAFAQICRVLVVTVLLLVAMQSLGIQIGALLTVGGIGALAVSFAAKDTLANFIGGLMLYWDRPFSIGDSIQCDGNIAGTVEKIGWRLTRMLTLDKETLYVPNSVFSNASIANLTRRNNRRIRMVLGLRYEDAEELTAIVKEIKKMLLNHHDVDTSLGVTVAFTELGASSLNILVQAFVKTVDSVTFYDVQQDVLLQIMNIVQAHEADFAFPTTTINIPAGIELIQTEEGDDEQRFQ